MFEERAVSAAHIEYAFGLLFYRKVEQSDQDFIDGFKIRIVCTAASPDVHFAVYVNLIGAVSNHSQDQRIAENQLFHFSKCGQIRNRYAISRSPFGKKQTGFRKLVIAIFFVEPT